MGYFSGILGWDGLESGCALGYAASAVHNGLSLKILRFDYA